MDRKLADYIASELRVIVPVSTGTLRDSIESKVDGVHAVDYYDDVMRSDKYIQDEEAAIERAWLTFKKDFEDQLEL